MLNEGAVDPTLGVFPECVQWQRRRPLFQWRVVRVFDSHLVKTRRKHQQRSFNGGSWCSRAAF
jgi:LysR family transcriptional activator of mexEF-oprN operon